MSTRDLDAAGLRPLESLLPARASTPKEQLIAWIALTVIWASGVPWAVSIFVLGQSLDSPFDEVRLEAQMGIGIAVVLLLVVAVATGLILPMLTRYRPNTAIAGYLIGGVLAVLTAAVVSTTMLG